MIGPRRRPRTVRGPSFPTRPRGAESARRGRGPSFPTRTRRRRPFGLIRAALECGRRPRSDARDAFADVFRAARPTRGSRADTKSTGATGGRRVKRRCPARRRDRLALDRGSASIVDTRPSRRARRRRESPRSGCRSTAPPCDKLNGPSPGPWAPTRPWPFPLRSRPARRSTYSVLEAARVRARFSSVGTKATPAAQRCKNQPKRASSL